MKKVIILDDKATNINTLKALLEGFCPDVSVAATATDIETGYQCIQQHRPDIVFLDIELNHENGFDLIHRFSHVFFEIIFTTAYQQYAVEAFKVQALDYLLKPIGIDALQASIAKAEQKIALKQANQQLLKLLGARDKNDSGKIALATLEGYKLVDPKDIVYCEASGSYTYFFFTNGKKEILSIRIGECERLLPQSSFFRVHHSYIVNLSYVEKYIKGRGGYLMLHNGIQVDVSVSRKEAFLKTISKPA